MPIARASASLQAALLCIVAGTANGATVPETRTEHVGDELRWVIPLSGLGATVFYEHGWRGTWQWTESYFAAHIVTASLKHVTHQTRPNGECCGSFPSGHASTAFMGAGFIHARYGWRWALPAYVGAGYVAYSRVYADKHYTRDVVAGAAVGILASFYFTSPYKDVSVVPIAGDGIIGIRISGDF